MSGSFLISVIFLLHQTYGADKVVEAANEDVDNMGENYIAATLRDLLYRYTRDLYEFIKDHYGESYDPIKVNVANASTPQEDIIEEETKYEAFEDCKQWWISSRLDYILVQFVLIFNNPSTISVQEEN